MNRRQFLNNSALAMAGLAPATSAATQPRGSAALDGAAARMQVK